MNTLETCRKEINQIDVQMAALFEERLRVCEQIAAFKKENGLSIRDSAREIDLINKNKQLIQSEEIASYYVQFLRNTIDLSCAYQSKIINGMRVTYCGSLGSFSHLATKHMFPEAELSAAASFTDAYRAVEQGQYDCAVLPLENSSAGEVGTVMDLIFSGSLHVNQVIDVPIIYHLMGAQNASLESVKTVIAHPHVLNQCGEFIREHGLQTEVCNDASLAAKRLTEADDPTLALIASEEVQAMFQLKLLQEQVSDNKANVTRFAAFSRAQNRPVSGKKRSDENFMLVFSVPNEAGALAQTLNIVGAHGFNMCSLRSRPMKNLQWGYFCFIEAEGNINTENGQDMLRELSAVCAKLKLVGSYYANNMN